MIAESHLQVSQIQEIMMKELENVTLFLAQRQSPIFLLGGSLLGLKRHQGFIPWDDDLDIGLLREDYDYLAANYQATSKQFKLLTESDSDNVFPYMRLVDTRTIGISEYYQQKLGVFIDIFPIDFIDTNEKYLNKYLWQHKLLNVLRNAARSTGKHDSKAKAVGVKKVIESILPYGTAHYFAKLEIKHAKCFVSLQNVKATLHLGGVLNGMYGKKEFFPQEYWLDYETELFNGVPVQVIKAADLYLTQMFGDWETPIKSENQHAKFYKI